MPEVRVIGADGTQFGIMPTHQAMKIAEEGGNDLVEVSPKAVPPVCRIMDYGKFKYEQSKQQAKARKHASTIILKEVKFRPKTDDHDFDFKVRHIRRFLGEGNKAKLVIVFRGREIVHPETGQSMLKQVFEACQDIAVIEQNPMMEGRRMLMILAPKAGVIRPATPSAGPAGPTSSTGSASPSSSSSPTAASPASSSAPSPTAAAPASAPTAAAPASAPTAAAPASAPTASNPPAPAASASAPAAPRQPQVTHKAPAPGTDAPAAAKPAAPAASRPASAASPRPASTPTARPAGSASGPTVTTKRSPASTTPGTKK